jgi:hypothetical protein
MRVVAGQPTHPKGLRRGRDLSPLNVSRYLLIP